MDTRAQNTGDYFTHIFGGKDKIPSILRGKLGPDLKQQARSCVRYAWAGFPAKKQEEQVAKVVLWMVRHNQQQPVIRYIKNAYSRDALRKAIETDKLCPR